MDSRRLAAVLAGVWAGVIAGIGAIAAPAAFAILQRNVAGAVAGRMFAHEAYLGLAVSVALLVLVRRHARMNAKAGRGSVFSLDLILVLIALFCTLFGYFGLQPLMAAAREGQGMWSFGALHGASAVFFGLKGLVALVLLWRLSAPSA
ncbi:MAG: DUF4149 domain-containing protein [Rhizobacter sp.]|nr:DUF4149 domain-containing protein [Rhizobacter sp.]